MIPVEIKDYIIDLAFSDAVLNIRFGGRDNLRAVLDVI